MAINFPNSPSVNDIHVSGSNRWQWNGSSWTRIGGVNSDADAINATNDNSTTTLYPVMVSGTGNQTAKVSTSSTKNISFDASEGDLTVGGNISIGGTATFTGSISVGGTATYEDVRNVDSIGIVTARAGVIVTGNLDTDTLNVSGVSTFTGNIDANGDLDVDGHTNLDNVSISGVATAASGQLISGVGIDTSGTVVGYAATIIHFRGPGVSTAYYSATTGVGTVYFQGGGGSASVSISESAPSSPSAGDMWWDSDVGNLQIYYTDSNSSQWVTANNSGPQGPQGAQGATGAQGHQGVQGAQGHQGHQGVQGAVGAQGAQGHQGVQGSVGIASLTISTGAPSSPAQGDMWWDSDDGDLHLYFNDGSSSQWVNINAGSAGAQGVQGAAGAAGAQGAQGATGSATISNNADNRVITGGSGTNLNGEASLTFDGTQLEVNGSSTNYPIKVSGSANAKVLLTGASSPYIQWQEGTTNRAYAWWDSNNNRFELKNEQENTYLRLDSQINFSIGNSEKVRIDSSGRLLVGHTAAYGSGKAQVFNTAQYVLDLSTWSADANGPTIDFYKSRNATIGSSTVVQSGDVIGKLRFLGNDGANSRTAAQITAEVDGTPGTNDMPGRLVFSTVPDNSTSVTERLRITSAGVVSINDSTPETWAALQVKNGSGSNAAQFLLHGADMAQIMLKDDTGGSNTKITTIRNDQGTLLIGTHNDAYGGFAHKYRITTAGTHVFGGNTAAPIVDNGELLYRGNSTQTFESLPQSFYVYGDSLGSGSANAGTGLVLGGKYRTDGQITTFAGIHGIKENTTNDEYGGALVFGVRQNGSSSWERLRIKSDGQIKKKQGANVTSLKTYNSNADAFWLDHYQYQSSGTYQRYTDIVSIGDGSWGSNIRFFTNANGSQNGIERLRITSAGSLLAAGNIGLDGSTYTYHQLNNHQAYTWCLSVRNHTSGYGIRVKTQGNSSGREGYYLWDNANSQGMAAIYMNGTYDSRNNDYGGFSDIKLKENIVDAKSQWDDVKAIKFRNFNFKKDDSSKKMLGVIAQELESISPGLVEDIPDKEENSEGNMIETGEVTKHVRYSVLYMKAIKALQEAMIKIETLEAKVAALESS